VDQRGTTRPPEKLGDAWRVGALVGDVLERLAQQESQRPPLPACEPEERPIPRIGRKSA
jgi:hypothetical protein